MGFFMLSISVLMHRLRVESGDFEAVLRGVELVFVLHFASLSMSRPYLTRKRAPSASASSARAAANTKTERGKATQKAREKKEKKEKTEVRKRSMHLSDCLVGGGLESRICGRPI